MDEDESIKFPTSEGPKKIETAISSKPKKSAKEILDSMKISILNQNNDEFVKLFLN
jgi:hypothetical protein